MAQQVRVLAKLERYTRNITPLFSSNPVVCICYRAADAPPGDSPEAALSTTVSHRAASTLFNMFSSVAFADPSASSMHSYGCSACTMTRRKVSWGCGTMHAEKCAPCSNSWLRIIHPSVYVWSGTSTCNSGIVALRRDAKTLRQNLMQEGGSRFQKLALAADPTRMVAVYCSVLLGIESKGGVRARRWVDGGVEKGRRCGGPPRPRTRMRRGTGVHPRGNTFGNSTK